MKSSGKKLALLTVVAVAAAAAVLFGKQSPSTDAPRAVRAEPRDALARRLPGKGSAAGGVQHVLQTQEDSGLKVPTAATPGSADPRVGLEFSPSATGGYGHWFNPAGALLEPRLEVADGAPELAAPRGPQIDSAATAPSQPRTHVVVDGDTLTGLAARYLGSSDRYREIFAANRKVLTTPDLLPIGATLEIPPPDAGTTAASLMPATSSPVTGSPVTSLPAAGIVPVPKGALRGNDD